MDIEGFYGEGVVDETNMHRSSCGDVTWIEQLAAVTATQPERATARLPADVLSLSQWQFAVKPSTGAKSCSWAVCHCQEVGFVTPKRMNATAAIFSRSSSDR